MPPNMTLIIPFNHTCTHSI